MGNLKAKCIFISGVEGVSRERSNDGDLSELGVVQLPLSAGADQAVRGAEFVRADRDVDCARPAAKERNLEPESAA